MSVLEIVRDFPGDLQFVFDFVTRNENLVQWWCPPGVTLAENDLDFTREGPWWFVLVDPNGGRHRVEGLVDHIDPPKAVEFSMTIRSNSTGEITQDTRVRFELAAAGPDQTTFRLIQTGLRPEEIVPVRELGWAKPMAALEALVHEHHTRGSGETHA